MQQLSGLTELCEYLSISTEDTLAAFPTEQVVPLLVSERADGQGLGALANGCWACRPVLDMLVS